MLMIIGIIIIAISYGTFICWIMTDVESQLSRNCVVIMWVSAIVGIAILSSDIQDKVIEQTYKNCLLGNNKYTMEIHYKMLPDSTYIPSDTLFIKIK